MPAELDFSVLDPANAVLTLRSDLRFTPREFDREACYMIEDPLRGKFFRIGADEFALISFLDGKNTIAQAVGLSAEDLRERAFTDNEAMSVCHWLMESQLAVCGGAAQGERLAQSRTSRRKTNSRQRSIPWPCGFRCAIPTPRCAGLLPGRTGCSRRRPWSAGASSA